MKQKLFVLFAASFSLLSTFSYAHPNVTAHRGESENFNWGNGPEAGINRTTPGSTSSFASHAETRAQPSFNWGNGPNDAHTGSINNVNDASKFNWGNGPDI